MKQVNKKRNRPNRPNKPKRPEKPDRLFGRSHRPAHLEPEILIPNYRCMTPIFKSNFEGLTPVISSHNADKLEDTVKGRKNAFKMVGGRLLKVTYLPGVEELTVITTIVKGE